MQVFDDCISAFAQANDCQVAYTVEHVVIIRRPVVALDKCLILLVLLDCLILHHEVFFFLFGHVGCIQLHLQEFGLVSDLVVEGICALRQYVLYDNDALLVVVCKLYRKAWLVVSLLGCTVFTEH